MSIFADFQAMQQNRFRRNALRQQMQFDREKFEYEKEQDAYQRGQDEFANLVSLGQLGVSERNAAVNEGNLTLQQNQDQRAGAEEDRKAKEEARAQRERDYRTATSMISDYTGSGSADQDFAQRISKDPKAMEAAAALIGLETDQFNSYTDANGNKKPVTLHSFTYQDGNFFPVVKNAEGEILPLTDSRDTNNNSELTGIPAAKLNQFLKNGYIKANAIGAMIDNQGAISASMGTLTDYVNGAVSSDVRDQIINKYSQDQETASAAGQGTPNDSASITQMWSALQDIEDPKEFKKVAELMGLDLQPLIDSYTEQREAEWFAANPKSSLAQLLEDEGITEEKWNSYTPERRDKVINLLQERRTGTIAQIIDAFKVTGSLYKDTLSRPWKAATDLWQEQIVDTDLGRRIGLSSIDAPEYVPADRTAGVKGSLARIEEKEAPVTKEQVGDILTKRVPLDFELTNDNIITALKSGSQPNSDQVRQVMSYLNQRGISNDQELGQAVAEGRVSSNDAREAALILGQAQSGDVAQKLSVVQSALNLIERGDTEVGLQEQASMDYQEGLIDQYGKNYALSVKKHKQSIADKLLDTDLAAADKIIEKAEALDKSIREIVGIQEGDNINARKMKLDGNTATKLMRRMSGYYAYIKNMTRGSESARVAMEGLNPGLSLYIQARANSNEAGIFDSEFWKSIMRDDATGQLNDFDLRKLRVAEVKDGKPISIAYVEIDGVRGQSVLLEDIRDDNTQFARIIEAAAVANSEAAE